MTSMMGLAMIGIAVGFRRRLGAALAIFGAVAALGCGLAWQRAESARGAVLSRPVVATFHARVIRIDQRGSEKGIRLLLTPLPGADPAAALPRQVRVSAAEADIPAQLASGALVTVRARLMPPAEAMVPGAYDFSRNAWFQGIGATGKAIGKIERVGPAAPNGPSLRDRLSAHVSAQLNGSVGGIATAFVTGDRGAIAAADDEAMRNSGLAHLLSISGLHITAVVAAAMFLALRLLALSPSLALRFPLMAISAGIGALTGIGYTLLTGSEVPTVRSCIAAVLVMIGMAIGREAITLRLVATGALVVLLLWPESLVGPSFQLSFAAITSIVALHENRRFRALIERRDEGFTLRISRGLLSLILTGLVVELALAPIALFHFHKAGLYGALANIVAIPVTTFVIMPLEALALVFDTVGLGAPFWWAAGESIALLLWLAHAVSAAPGAVAMLPAIPETAFAAMIMGGLAILLLRSRLRWIGGFPLVWGVGMAVMTSPPDILITGDGRHMAVRGGDGRYAILRPRTGDYVRDMLSETAGYDAALDDLEAVQGARCSDDVCTVRVMRGGQSLQIMATRSRHILPWEAFTALCREADIVISDRTLPKGCTPRWFKADRALLSQTGGLAINVESARVIPVKSKGDRHPWILAAQTSEKHGKRDQYRRKRPASLP